MIGLSFKTGTDDLRKSPLVLLAEHFVGKRLTPAVYDPEVQLSSVLGTNRLLIEQHVPHLGLLLCDKLEDIIDESELLVVGLSPPAIFTAIKERARADQVIVDLVNMPNAKARRSVCEGLCW